MPKANLVTTLSLATLLTPAFAQRTPAAPRANVPGSITYIDGQAAVDGKEISVQTGGLNTLAPGQQLATGTGHADVFLAPGIFLRLDGNSVVKMISPAEGRSEVELDRGRAVVEVDFLPPYGNTAPVQVDLKNVSQATSQTGLLERGLYEFDADAGKLRVFDGKAQVYANAASDKRVTVKGGHEIALNGTAEKATGFHRDISGDSLLGFNDQRDHADYAYAGQGFGTHGDGYGYPGYGVYPYPLYAGFYGPYSGYPFYPGFYGGFGFYGGGFYRGGFRR